MDVDNLELAVIERWPQIAHAQKTNLSGRQVCCKTCHVCGNALKEILDGELWCRECGAYR